MDFKRTTTKELVSALTSNGSNFYYLYKEDINALNECDLKHYFVRSMGPAVKYSTFLAWGEKILELPKIKVYQYKNLFLVDYKLRFYLFELNFQQIAKKRIIWIFSFKNTPLITCLKLRAFNGDLKMIDRNTFLRVKEWFIAYLQQDRNGAIFEKHLLYREFNFYQDLIDFLDVINGGQFVRCKQFGPSVRDVWESNALNSILKEAKKLEILKNVRRDTCDLYRYDLVKELIEKMKTNRPYCLIIYNFLANSKLSDIPEEYTNLCILCKYVIDCRKVLENNYRFKYQLL